MQCVVWSSEYPTIYQNANMFVLGAEKKILPSQRASPSKKNTAELNRVGHGKREKCTERPGILY